MSTVKTVDGRRKKGVTRANKPLFLVAINVRLIIGSKFHYRKTNIVRYVVLGAVQLTVSESEGGHYIVIEDPRGDRFTLSCSKRDYDMVNVGDRADCERYESIVTYEGTVHKIEPIP